MYHIWMGRILITLGTVNGGLGLLYSANATKGEQIAYGVVAGVIWASRIAIVIAVLAKQGKEIPGTINRKKRAGNSPEDGSVKGSF